MKILYIITKSEIGGAQTHLMEIVRYMHHVGHDILVVTSNDGWLTEELLAIHVDYIVVPELVREISLYRDIKAVLRLKEIMVANAPDIVHCHSSKAGIVGRIASYLLNIPSVFTAHGWAFTEGVSFFKRVVYAFIEHTMLVFTRKVLCVSEYDRLLAKKWFLVNHNQIITVHNGISDKKNPSQTISSNICLENTKALNIVMVARFAPPKNQIDLIKAIEYINCVKPDSYTVSFVGDGILLSDCHQYVITHNLEKMIHFLGNRTDVDVILNQNDIFCLISNYEGLPISIIEAMRAEMPIIASDVCGVNELVQDGTNGFLIPRGNISELVDKLKYILNHKELIKSMGEASRKIYEEEYTADKMNQKIFSVYNEVTAVHKRK